MAQGTEPPQRKWQFDLGAAEAVMEQALAQREADRAREGFVPNAWAAVAEEVYGWQRAKTYLAAVLCGLVARATDPEANPLSLQVGEDEESRGYAATSLWQAVQGVSQGRIDLRALKSQPFNNSPFSGKRLLSTDWENVARFNVPVLARTVELMEEVGEMSAEDAGSALRSFLWAAPDAADARELVIDRSETHVDLPVFFDALDSFLLDDGENGRRAQAMVAASFALVHPENVDTPASVNDPSRSLAGDVRVLGTVQGVGSLALFAEAKQKLTHPEWVGQFVEEIKQKSPGGVGAYAALVNDRVRQRAKRASALPTWRSVLDETGVLMSLWENPADMVREAIVWSALAADDAVARFVGLYVRYLRHVDVDQRTIDDWLARAKAFGVAVVD